jgi:hypothetical protein
LRETSIGAAVGLRYFILALMPVNDHQQAAICRITSKAGTGIKRGTGFLIAPGRVLTAFHVVGDRPNKTLGTGPFKLEFGPRTGGKIPFETSVKDVLAHDATDDWAVLVPAQDPPETTRPFPLSLVPRDYIVRWSTWGFPDSEPDEGRAYEGTVTIDSDELQLYTPETLVNDANRIGGLSGSPCLVDGKAVGVIVAASDMTKVGYTNGGALFVLSLRAVAKKFAALPMPAPPPPFVNEVADYLSAPQSLQRLKAIARQLKLTPEAIAPERLPVDVATEILRGGLARVADTVIKFGSALDRTKALDIVDCAGSLWVDEGAAAMVATAATDGAYSPIALNVSGDDSANRYLHRAGYPTHFHPGWRRFGAMLMPPPGERQLRGLVEGVKEILRKKLHCTDEEIQTELAAYEDPIFILLPPPIPGARHLSCLRKVFKRVNFVALLGAQVHDDFTAAYPDVRLVEPRLTATTEKNEREDYVRRRNRVKDFYAENGATG